MRRDGERCPDNLLARSRRGLLSPVERQALDAHLDGCGLCRSAVALAAAYDDAPGEPEPGDEAVIARLAGRVARRASGRRLRPRVVGSIAAAAILIVACGAAAWVASRPRVSAPPAAAPMPERTTTLSRAVVPVAKPAPQTTVAVALEPPRAASVRSHGHALRRGPAAEAAALPLPDPGPAELFAAANAARRAGELRGAISQYLALERRYPASSQAGISRVSAGDLLLRLDEPAAALEQFDLYLGAHGSEPLAPEALFGRARCLRALGRSDDERAAWNEMARRFPGSVYEPSGRRRLEELGR